MAPYPLMPCLPHNCVLTPLLQFPIHSVIECSLEYLTDGTVTKGLATGHMDGLSMHPVPIHAQ